MEWIDGWIHSLRGPLERGWWRAVDWLVGLYSSGDGGLWNRSMGCPWNYVRLITSYLNGPALKTSQYVVVSAAAAAQFLT